MPSLGADMEAGTLIEWEKKPGDTVHRGDVIAVVETQKGAIEIEVFEDGILDTCLVDIGRKVPVGTPLALIKGQDNSPPEPVSSSIPKPSATETSAPETAKAKPSARNTNRRVRVSPAARKLADRHGVGLEGIIGSGPDGAISLRDVNTLVETDRRPEENANIDVPPCPTLSDNTQPAQSAMRGAIGAAMARSKKEIPHFYLSQTIDLSAAEAFVSDSNAERPPEDRLVLGALYMKATALALARFPEFNGHYVDDAFRPVASVHAGMAINIRGGGLAAPAIHDTQELPLDALMQAMKDLVARVRAGRFRATELSDPTITLSSLGERGVESLYGVIYPPQVAIVGFGTPVRKPFEVDEGIEWRPSVVITLAGDHRVSDGHRGALFINAIQKWLQSPEKLT